MRERPRYAPIHPRWQFRALLRDERGVSLVEVLVGIAIVTGIAAFIGTAVWQFFTVTRWGNDRMLVASDHQTALLWLSRDSAEANRFVPGGGSDYGTFYWPGDDPYFVYRYDASQEALIRDHYDGGVLESNLVVARSIVDQGDVTFNATGQLVTVSITATQGDVAETIDLQLAMRVP